MDSLKTKFNNLKQKPMLIFGMGCLLIFIFSFFFTYYLRVIYSPVWLGQVKGTAAISVALCTLWGMFYFSSKLKDKDLFMTILLFVMGLVFCFSTPPNQVPDEQSHFLRSYAMAQGQFGFDENHIYPDDVNLLMKYFPVAYNNSYKAREGQTIYNRFEDYRNALENGEQRDNTGIIIFQVIPIAPGI